MISYYKEFGNLKAERYESMAIPAAWTARLGMYALANLDLDDIMRTYTGFSEEDLMIMLSIKDGMLLMDNLVSHRFRTRRHTGPVSPATWERQSRSSMSAVRSKSSALATGTGRRRHRHSCPDRFPGSATGGQTGFAALLHHSLQPGRSSEKSLPWRWKGCRRKPHPAFAGRRHHRDTHKKG